MGMYRYWLGGPLILLLACDGSPAPPEWPLAPPTHDLVDDFAGDSIDTRKWALYASEAGVAQDDRVAVTLTPHAPDYSGLIYREPHRFAGSSFFVEVSQPASGRPTTETFVGLTTPDQEEFVLITSLAGRVEAWYRWRGQRCSDSAHKRVIDKVTYCRLGSIPFDPDAHRFRRVREHGGTVVFELSPDGVTWNLPGGWSLVHRFTNLNALHGLLGAGAYRSDPDPGVAFFENVNTTVPAVPRGLNATLTAPGRVLITWDDRSVNEAGFTVERRVAGGTFEEIATLGADTAEFRDIGVSGGITYEYRVRAYNPSGTSAYARAVQITP